MDRWTPLRFEPDVERAYSLHMMQRIVPLGRLAFGFGAVTFAAYAWWDTLLDANALATTGPIRIAIIGYFSLMIALMFVVDFRARRMLWAVLVLNGYLVVATGFTLIMANLPGGFVAGVGGLIVGMIFVPVITINARDAAVVLISYLFASLVVMFVSEASQFEVLNMLSWTGAGISFALGFSYLLDIVNRQAFDLERRLAVEMERSDALLLNILPRAIAERLKQDEDPLVDSHASVSVLFADLAGFTNFTRNLPAHDLVNLLNDLFSRFDGLATEHGAEKIKTIGDAYMVATGLTGDGARHAERLAEMALAMRTTFRDFCVENDVDLNIRIGIHSGPVVAGVIGKQKFSYDLWGDTVNIASRMESESENGQIQISQETRDLLPETIKTTARGVIAIKGHAPRQTYVIDVQSLAS